MNNASWTPILSSIGTAVLLKALDLLAAWAEQRRKAASEQDAQVRQSFDEVQRFRTLIREKDQALDQQAAEIDALQAEVRRLRAVERTNEPKE